jgi:ATP-dependent RNA helicase DeaD
MQVAEAVHKYGRGFGTRVLAVYGGAAMGQQLRALSRGVDVVIATPGRALDHVNRGTLRLSNVQVLVLDEADEMLDMGFEEDLTAIVGATPKERQTALFSATMAPRVARVADSYLRAPQRVEVARRQLAEGEMPRVRTAVYLVPRPHKAAALGRVLDVEAPTSAIVFCRTRTEADELTETLAARGFGAEALHGGMGQEARDRVMRRFRGGQVELLVATDVAARGLDVEHVSHVGQLRRAERARRVRAPRRPHRPRRPRGRGRSPSPSRASAGLLRNIERVIRQQLTVLPVPTPAELRTRRSERTAAAVRAVLDASRAEPTAPGTGASRDDAESGDGLAAFRSVAEVLSADYDLLDVAAAALRLSHEATAGAGDEDEAEIPSLHQPAGGARRDARDARPERGGRFERTERPGGRPERGQPFDRGERMERPERAPRRRPAGGDTVRLYVGLGRQAGIRPADLVGAIVNEAGIQASDVGAIDIADRFSLVEVPAAAADGVIGALRATTIRGERPLVRPDRELGEERAEATARPGRPFERGARPERPVDRAVERDFGRPFGRDRDAGAPERPAFGGDRARGSEGEERGPAASRGREPVYERPFERPRGEGEAGGGFRERPAREGGYPRREAGGREFGGPRDFGGRESGRGFDRAPGGGRDERPGRFDRPERPFGGPRRGGAGGGGRPFGPRRGRD